MTFAPLVSPSPLGEHTMSRLIVLYNYNKYYNRIIKKKSSFQEYLNLITPQGDNPAEYRGFIRENMNFDYQDGVYAQHVININKNDPEYMKIEHPDYCVLEQTYTQGTGDDAITTTKVTRYFILECAKIRGNQWQLSLRRDLLADYWDQVMYSPVFIEKGNISDANNPLLFNKESMTYNQIKQAETLLTQTKFSGKGSGWIVGYIAKQETKTSIGPCVGLAEAPAATLQYEDLPDELKTAITNEYFYEYSALNGLLSFHVYDTGKFPNSYLLGHLVPRISSGNYTHMSRITGDVITASSYLKSAYVFSNSDIIDLSGLISSYYTQSLNAGNPDIVNAANTVIENTRSDFVLDSANLSTYNGIVYEKDNKLYRLTIERKMNSNLYLSYTNAQIGAGSDILSNAIKKYLEYLAEKPYFELYNYTSTSSSAYFLKQFTVYNLTIEEVNYDEVKTTITATRNNNFDAPYDMFCIPYGEVDVYSSGSKILTTISNIALPIARGIALKGTTDLIYDIQLLPYCPFPEILKTDGDIDITGFVEGRDYSYITKTVSGVTTNVGILLYPKACKGTFDINLGADSEDPNANYYVASADAYNRKIKSETEIARFVSPNFASTFEINVQKNNGISVLNIDYFYKPYSPYIHVAPYFSFMYGNDYNDPKGLICSGDFSIATSSSQWEKYQIENKNYELIFNRQIQNLDINNSIEYQVQEKTSGIGIGTSILTGAGAGAVSGAMVGSAGGPIGTAVGAVAGAVIGGVSGAITSSLGRKYDLEYLKQSQIEARSYNVDMYGFNLGNVRALPYTLTKISAFTPNNKIFPFIEFYKSTDTEIEALERKITYNGMTVMKIGYISDYLDQTNGRYYVQGQLIRLTGIEEDSQVIAEIAKEIKEGAYYYGSDSE